MEHSACKNCDQVLAPQAHYCSGCGQKIANKRITVWSMLKTFIGSIFNLESRTWKTILHLWIPARLTKAYFAGKHQRYMHPVRIFLVTAILFAASLGYLASFIHEQTLEMDIESYRKIEKEELLGHLLAYRDSLDSGAPAEFIAGVDSSILLLNDTLALDRDSIHLSLFNNPFIYLSEKDLFGRPIEELKEMNNVDGFFQDLLFTQFIRLYRERSQVGPYIIGRIAWYFFLLIPMLALMLKLLYIRRKKYYVEHLVFTLHGHAIYLIAMSIIFFIERFEEVDNNNVSFNFVQMTFLFVPVVYLYLRMKAFYGQSRWKTWIKFFTYLFFYSMVAVFAFAIILIVGLLLF